jgi:copper transport protein
MRRALGVLVAAGGLAVLIAPPASAHALVKLSNPAAGAILQQPPPQVVITFTEPPDPALSFMHVLNAAGADVENGKSGPVPGRPLELRVSVPTLPRGVYTVTWRTVSRVDGHVTGGSFSFGVGVAPRAGNLSGVNAPTTPSPTAAAVAGRWAFDWGLLLLLGAAASVLFVFRELPAGGRALLWGSWALAAVGLVTMTLAERSSVGISLAALVLHSGVGHEFVRRGAALAITGATVGFAVWRPDRGSFLIAGLATAGAMLVHSLAGHAGASGRFTWFNVGVQWVHLLAVGVWVGGLAWLLLGTRGGASDRAVAIRRFSWLAGVALAAVAGTGILRAVDEIGGPSDWRRLIDTSFGVALLVKIGLIAGLVALGARNRYVNVPKVSADPDRARPLRRSVGAEVLIAVGILGATAVLSELPPASTLAAAAPKASAPQRIVVAGSDFGTSTRVRLTVTPGTVGPNRFDAQVTDFDTGRPVDATAVSLHFGLPGRPDLGTPTVGLARSVGGDWTGQGTVLSIGGTWDVSVVVQRPGGGVTVPLRLQTLLPPEQITVSRVPGQPTLYTIALTEGTLQTYVDPAVPGRINQVHFTFFQQSGAESPIASATATAALSGGEAAPMKLIRFDAGHFVANQMLSAGSWRFEIQATARDGRVIDAYFDQQIGT